MENLELLRQFDGKALLVALFAWAAAFNAWQAWRWKRAWVNAETAFTKVAKENIELRNKARDGRRQDHFLTPEEQGW